MSRRPAGARAHPATNPLGAALNAAASATAAALRFEQPADVLLSIYFREHKSGGRDRALIAESLYAVLRRKRSLERLAALGAGAEAIPLPKRLVVLAVLKSLGWSQRQVGEALRPREAAWLADCLHAAEELPEPVGLGERLDLPDWLAERLSRQQAPADVDAMVRAMNNPAPLDLRVNTLKAERGAVLAQLQGEGLRCAATPLAPEGIRLADKPALSKHPLFESGAIEVQDEGSQLLGLLLQPRRGELVVDFCAGAGGKTLQLGALMRSTGRLYAFDVSERRLAKLKPRAARAGLSNVHPIAITGEADQRVKRLAGKADRVLVDAPCSGLGTLRRNPDLKWRQSLQSVAELSAKQATILAAAARLVRPGGRLVYATCSLLDEENQAIVDAFLASHPEFVGQDAQAILAAQGVKVDCGATLRLRPDVHGTDGFYAAVLERSA